VAPGRKRFAGVTRFVENTAARQVA
jgi:hypothetical protein